MSGDSVRSAPAFLKELAFNPISLMPENEKKANVTIATFE